MLFFSCLDSVFTQFTRWIHWFVNQTQGQDEKRLTYWNPFNRLKKLGIEKGYIEQLKNILI